MTSTQSNTQKVADFSKVKSHAEAMDAIHHGSDDLAKQVAHAAHEHPSLAHVGLGLGYAMEMLARKACDKLYSEVKANIKDMRENFTTGKAALKRNIKRREGTEREHCMYHPLMMKYYDAAMQFQADLYNRDFDKAEASLKLTITLSNLVMADMMCAPTFILSHLRDDRHNFMVDFIKAIVSKCTMEFPGVDDD